MKSSASRVPIVTLVPGLSYGGLDQVAADVVRGTHTWFPTAVICFDQCERTGKELCHAVTQSSTRLGGVARFAPMEDHEPLLRAIALLRTLRIEIDVIRDGSDAGSFARLTHEPGIAHRLCFPGHHDDVRELRETIDVFVGVWQSKGSPCVIMEAMAAGRPVLCPDIPGHSTLLEDGRTGRLFPTGDASAAANVLAEIVADPNQRAALVRAAQVNCRGRYPVETMVVGYDRIFREMTQ